MARACLLDPHGGSIDLACHGCSGTVRIGLTVPQDIYNNFYRIIIKSLIQIVLWYHLHLSSLCPAASAPSKFPECHTISHPSRSCGHPERVMTCTSIPFPSWHMPLTKIANIFFKLSNPFLLPMFSCPSNTEETQPGYISSSQPHKI